MHISHLNVRHVKQQRIPQAVYNRLMLYVLACVRVRESARAAAFASVRVCYIYIYIYVATHNTDEGSATRFG